ncbi:probable E3 ubiquitin ligase complex SCF subunit sconB [Acanthaster planci]|uniref:Probable E3 ubiquitin ligase complex SCF subunit sconB n=1 Tax=Acanthaster planci TaxID=133434 RepID=A0A8B7YUV7_ACAPL|nr:probable E3 ubiquitin ligase complex SCF subunit sconB [Acanthaster planci]
MFTTDFLSSLPNEITCAVLSYLSANELCQVSLCSKSCREKSNSDALWRRLLKNRGWEHYGTDLDLSKKTGFLKYEADDVIQEGYSANLMPTCKLKTAFIRASRLEANWQTGTFQKHCISLSGVDCRDGIWDSDGEFVVYAFNEGVSIWSLEKSDGGHDVGGQAGSNTEDSDYYKRKLLPHPGWIAQSCKVSKGVGLATEYENDCFVHTIRLFNCKSANWMMSYKEDDEAPTKKLRFDTKTLIGTSSCRPSELIVWNSFNGSSRHVLKGHVSEIKDLALSDTRAASAAESVRLWDVEQGVCLHVFLPSVGFTCCHIVGEHLLGGFRDTLLFWNMVSKKQLATITDFELRLMSVNNSIVACSDGCVRVWNNMGDLIKKHPTTGDKSEGIYELLVGGTRVVIQGRFKGLKVLNTGQSECKSPPVLFESGGLLQMLWMDDLKLVVCREHKCEVLHFW